MESSTTCKLKKEKYESVQNSINSLVNNINNCQEYLNLSKESINQLRLNDEPIDDGKFDKFSQEQASIAENLNVLIKECIAKALIWNSKYLSALQNENQNKSENNEK